MVNGGDTKEKKNVFSNKYLVVILLVLLVIIIGLVIAIIISYNSGDNNQNTGSSESNDEYIDSLIEEDEVYQISSNISKIYNSGEKEKALGMYDEELNKALESQDYDMYTNLVTARSTMLSLDGTCEELMAQYDKIDINKIPVDYRESIYTNAIYDSTNCGDVERETYWRTMANE